MDAFHFDLSKSKGIRERRGAKEPAPESSQAEPELAEKEGDVNVEPGHEPNEDGVDENEVPHTNGPDEEVLTDSKAKALSPEAATTIHTAIAIRLLPRLQKVLNQKVGFGDSLAVWASQ